MDTDLQSIQQARLLIDQAYQAQIKLATFSQEQVDTIVKQMAVVSLAAAEKLAKIAVEETGFGNLEDKILKNKFASEFVFDAIKDLKTVGIIREDLEKGILEIAAPVGVIAAVIPSTNPTSTTINKALIALKSRNSIVFSPHPSATKCIKEASGLLAEAAEAAGAPKGVIGCLAVTSVEGTQELMKHKKTSLILATGGQGLVKAAYSVGKPAFGVGPGNVPAYIETSADIPQAVKAIFTGKCFDNGTLCSSEQAIVTDKTVKEQVVHEIERNGGHFLSNEEIEVLGKLVVTANHKINPKIVGRSALTIASLAGLKVPEKTKVLVAPLTGVGHEHPLSIEKLSPILAFYVQENWQEACDRCMELINFGGLGHTLAIHSNNEEIIREFGLQKPVSRIVVNTQAALGAVGYTTNLFPSMTLGCGVLGGNITSDNISPLHLINIKRVAYPRKATLNSSQQSELGSLGRPDVEAVVDRLLSSGDFGSIADVEYPSQGSTSKAQLQKPNQGLEGSQQFPSKLTSPEKLDQVVESQLTVSFVCEDDVRQALKAEKKIYINSKSIITPAAQDLGNANDVFINVP